MMGTGCAPMKTGEPFFTFPLTLSSKSFADRPSIHGRCNGSRLAGRTLGDFTISVLYYSLSRWVVE